MPPANGIAAIRAMWTQYFAESNFVPTWKAEKPPSVRQELSAIPGALVATATRPAHTSPSGESSANGSWKVLLDSAWSLDPRR
jgi:hypothetical protein